LRRAYPAAIIWIESQAMKRTILIVDDEPARQF
jgi:hypothetical protein